jgi:hypothetical protein
MTEQVQETSQETTKQQETSAKPEGAPDLNISDLAALKSILEIASQRGAFKANELEAVGKTYNKLSSFLESVIKKD